MCARFSLTSPLEAMRQLFSFSERPNLASSYNIAPSTRIAAIRPNTKEPKAARHLFFAEWGLIPSWTKTRSQNSPLINARSETVDQKPSFRHAFKTRRCLIPCNGFYEWKKEEDGSKQPYLIYSPEMELFAFAGLWETWKGTNGSIIESCTILTMIASERISRLHHRMPVTLKPDVYDHWLNGTTRDSLPSNTDQLELDYYPVDKKVGNIRNNSADLTSRIELPAVSQQGRLF